ncbi:MAG: hypothetical protein AB4368_08740 [Xenococcaceae cyanobacterium]
MTEININTQGVFQVDETGAISFDYLYDGGWFQGELAVFSLQGMENYQAGSQEFMVEAARRALTNSQEGRILLQDRQQGAKFSENLAWENNFNAGEYQGVKTFEMTAGDELAFMLVQHTTLQIFLLVQKVQLSVLKMSVSILTPIQTITMLF